MGCWRWESIMDFSDYYKIIEVNDWLDDGGEDEGNLG